MPDIFAVDTTELNEFGQQMVAAAQGVHKIVVLQIGNLGEFVKYLCRVELEDVRYTGELEGSFVVEVKPAEMEAWIYPKAKHSPFMRMGTRPHWAPIGPLKAWAAAKLGDEKLAYPVRWSISQHGTSMYQLRKRGTKANPWPQRVVARSDFQTAVKRTAENIGGEIVAEVFE